MSPIEIWRYLKKKKNTVNYNFATVGGGQKIMFYLKKFNGSTFGTPLVTFFRNRDGELCCLWKELVKDQLKTLPFDTGLYHLNDYRITYGRTDNPARLFRVGWDMRNLKLKCFHYTNLLNPVSLTMQENSKTGQN